MSKEQVAKLIDKATEAHDANDALKFSQAALNAANAMLSMKDTEKGAKPFSDTSIS